MMIKTIQLQHTSLAITQYREILRKLGICWQEKFVNKTPDISPAHIESNSWWEITTQKDIYCCETLSCCFEEVIRRETPSYILRFALCRMEHIRTEEECG